jgi:sialate O-acetylesterase
MIEQGPYYYQTPSNYRETMLNRVIPFAIKGVLWYQGESNSHDNPPFCSHQEWVEAVMRTMFADWRRAFKNPTLPFYMVQLSAWGDGAVGEAMSWEPVRSAHEALANDEGIHTIVSIDVGEADNIHPANKKPVGERLALAALSCEYGLDVAWESPKIDKIEKTANEYRLTFTNVKDFSFIGDEPQGFFIRSTEGVRTPIAARLEGDKVYIPLSDDVAEISFCAQNYAKCNVYNEHGLPPFPFIRSV